MEAIPVLIKSVRLQVDEMQRALAGLEAEKSELSKALDRIDVEVKAEASGPGTDPRLFAAYAERKSTEKRQLLGRIASLTQSLVAARAALAESFIELKKLEVLEERLATRERLEAARKEQSELDEIALSHSQRTRA